MSMLRLRPLLRTYIQTNTYRILHCNIDTIRWANNIGQMCLPNRPNTWLNQQWDISMPWTTCSADKVCTPPILYTWKLPHDDLQDLVECRYDLEGYCRQTSKIILEGYSSQGGLNEVNEVKNLMASWIQYVRTFCPSKELLRGYVENHISSHKPSKYIENDQTYAEIIEIMLNNCLKIVSEYV